MFGKRPECSLLSSPSSTCQARGAWYSRARTWSTSQLEQPPARLLALEQMKFLKLGPSWVQSCHHKSLNRSLVWPSRIFALVTSQSWTSSHHILQGKSSGTGHHVKFCCGAHFSRICLVKSLFCLCILPMFVFAAYRSCKAPQSRLGTLLRGKFTDGRSPRQVSWGQFSNVGCLLWTKESGLCWKLTFWFA